MATKCNIARKLSEEGVSVIIAKGDRANILIDLLQDPETTPHTKFEPRQGSMSNIKRWIAHSGSFAKGIIHINENAVNALKSDVAASLLPIGITSIEGEWDEGDIVSLVSETGIPIGIGKASIGSIETSNIIGKRGGKPVVHYDYLFIE
jgi:glutamate 5-kinase